MGTLVNEKHYVAVAEHFLKNAYVFGTSPKAAGSAMGKHEMRYVGDEQLVESEVRTARTLSFLPDNVLETTARESMGPLLRSYTGGSKLGPSICKNGSLVRRTRLYSCNSADFGIAIFQRLSEVFGVEASPGTALSSTSIDLVDDVKLDKLATYSSLESLFISGRRLGISLKGLPVVMFSVLSLQSALPMKRLHTLSKTSECSETGGLRPFFEGSQSTSNLITGQSISEPETHMCISFSNLLNTSTLFTKNYRSRFTHVNSSHVDFFYSLDGLLYEFSSLLLDDNEFRLSGRKTTLTFAGYMTSIIDYVDPIELKKESNEKFRQKYPTIQLTYSKYLSIKKEMKEIASKADIDPTILAQAVSYFDQCVLKAFIDKCNRKHLAGVCLILAAKLNDVKGANLKNLIEIIGEQFRLIRSELFRYELPVAAALEFALHLPPLCIAAHYQKLAWES